MATNIVEAIQKALGFATLQKIDPNTQDVIKPENLSAENYLPQAAIPTILLCNCCSNNTRNSSRVFESFVFLLVKKSP